MKKVIMFTMCLFGGLVSGCLNLHLRGNQEDSRAFELRHLDHPQDPQHVSMSIPERKLANSEEEKAKKPKKRKKNKDPNRFKVHLREAEPWMENARVIKDSAVAMEGSSKWALMIILMSWYLN